MRKHCCTLCSTVPWPKWGSSHIVDRVAAVDMDRESILYIAVGNTVGAVGVFIVGVSSGCTKDHIERYDDDGLAGDDYIDCDTKSILINETCNWITQERIMNTKMGTPLFLDLLCAPDPSYMCHYPSCPP